MTAEDYDWLRWLGAGLVKGKWEDLCELPDGRAPLLMTFPTLGDRALFVDLLNALRAMTMENAPNENGPVAAELRAIVIRYHNGDD